MKNSDFTWEKFDQSSSKQDQQLKHFRDKGQYFVLLRHILNIWFEKYLVKVLVLVLVLRQTQLV